MPRGPLEVRCLHVGAVVTRERVAVERIEQHEDELHGRDPGERGGGGPLNVAMCRAAAFDRITQTAPANGCRSASGGLVKTASPVLAVTHA